MLKTLKYILFSRIGVIFICLGLVTCLAVMCLYRNDSVSITDFAQANKQTLLITYQEPTTGPFYYRGDHDRIYQFYTLDQSNKMRHYWIKYSGYTSSLIEQLPNNKFKEVERDR